jgi:hypothetical protein
MEEGKEKYIHRITKLIMNKSMPLIKKVQQQPISIGKAQLDGEEEKKLLKVKK